MGTFLANEIKYFKQMPLSAVLFSSFSTSWNLEIDTNVSFLAVYSQYGLVIKACERGTFVQIKVYERSTFSVKIVSKEQGFETGLSLPA